MRRVTVRALLALYPQQVRDRYGDEIAGLLAESRTPGRDAVDIARTALHERLATLTAAQLGRAALRLLSWLLIIAATPGVLFLATMLAILFSPGAVALAALAGIVVGRRARRRWWLPAATAVASAAALASIPATAGAFASASRPAIIAVAVWTVGAVALLALVVALTRRGADGLSRRRRLGLAAGAALGGLALMELVSIVFVVLRLPAWLAPREYALAWYWTAMLPTAQFPIGGGDIEAARAAGWTVEAGYAPETMASFAVFDALELLPVLMTLSLVFALACAYRGRTARPA